MCDTLWRGLPALALGLSLLALSVTALRSAHAEEAPAVSPLVDASAPVLSAWRVVEGLRDAENEPLVRVLHLQVRRGRLRAELEAASRDGLDRTRTAFEGSGLVATTEEGAPDVHLDRVRQEGDAWRADLRAALRSASTSDALRTGPVGLLEVPALEECATLARVRLVTATRVRIDRAHGTVTLKQSFEFHAEGSLLPVVLLELLPEKVDATVTEASFFVRPGKEGSEPVAVLHVTLARRVLDSE